MALSKDEKIVRLRRGIASSETSDALRAIMQSDLDELLKPEPVYVAPEPKQTPVKKAVKKPVAKKEESKIETPPPPPTITQEEKDRLKAEYVERLAKKKAKQTEEN